MERKIGEVFKIKNEWYQCILAPDGSCLSCDLFTSLKACPIPIRECTGSGRTDKSYVIFKKLKKIGEPYEYVIHNRYVVMVQEYLLPNASYIYNDDSGLFAKDCYNGRIAIQIEQNKKENMKIHKVVMNSDDRDYLLDRLEAILHDTHCQQYKDEICEAFSKYIVSDSQSKLKPFDLEAAKAGKQVCTRDGQKVRIICFDRNGNRPIIALTTKKDADGNYVEEVCDYYKNGRREKSEEYWSDLMMPTEKREG